MTPLLQQYFKMKEQCPAVILFIRIGGFYECFGEDAKTVADACGLTLTCRRSDEERLPMCGAPFHSIELYVKKLVSSGHRVALADQIED